jgi:uncharacterized Ntn-hydrolase superfamily protein
MTWSIIARDAASGAFGVGIATRFFAAGALCPHAQSGVGALSTQALVNPHYGAQALELLRGGLAAPEVVRRVIAPDEGREHRQLHVIDAAGLIGQHTGNRCIEWCGALAGEGYSVAGNMLANERVLRDTARAYEKHAGPFAERLIVALAAGEAAGGDKRGKQSAALVIYSTEQYADLDLRVDDHIDPLAELRRLYEKAHERFIPYLRCAPSKARPAGVFDREVIEDEIARFQKARGRTAP